jgi:hypothetical protein
VSVHLYDFGEMTEGKFVSTPDSNPGLLCEKEEQFPILPFLTLVPHHKSFVLPTCGYQKERRNFDSQPRPTEQLKKTDEKTSLEPQQVAQKLNVFLLNVSFGMSPRIADFAALPKTGEEHFGVVQSPLWKSNVFPDASHQ